MRTACNAARHSKPEISSILIIYPLHPRRNAGQYFVRNCIECIGEDGYREMVAEDFYAVALFAVDVRNVNHTNIHTDAPT